MLVLARKPGQEVHISGGIRIKLIRCNSGSARFGIEAPQEVRITRPESPAEKTEPTRTGAESEMVADSARRTAAPVRRSKGGAA